MKKMLLVAMLFVACLEGLHGAHPHTLEGEESLHQASHAARRHRAESAL